MKITIEGDPKEIAALVLELQERQGVIPGIMSDQIPGGEHTHTITMDEMMKGPHLFMGEWRYD